MGVALFTIGTATERINLLNKDGIMVRDWEPVESPVQEVWSDSPLADYGQLMQYRDVRAEEGMTIFVRGIDQDDCIAKIRGLRNMLRKARDYWTTPAQPSIIYIEAKASCETNSRYAWVWGGTVEQDGDPYAQ